MTQKDEQAGEHDEPTVMLSVILIPHKAKCVDFEDVNLRAVIIPAGGSYQPANADIAARDFTFHWESHRVMGSPKLLTWDLLELQDMR